MRAALPFALIAAALALSAQAAPLPAPSGPETVIPFIARDGIDDFRPNGRQGAWLRASNGHWFYARTLGPCPGLVDALSLGFSTSANDQLDRYGAIIAAGHRCQLASLIANDPPARKARSGNKN